MDSKEVVKGNKKISKGSPGAKEPRSLKIAQKGVETSSQFASLMSALMSDLIEGSVAPQVGNATCNAGGKLLKVVEMTYKYGTKNPDNTRVLYLTAEVKES